MSSTSRIASSIGPSIVIAAVLTLIPLAAAAFYSMQVTRWVQRLPLWVRLLGPAGLCVPYVLVAISRSMFRWDWFALYALLPVAVAGLLWRATRVDREQRGTWRDFLVLATLGLAVDLRWFEHAWPAHFAVFGKMLLVDMGIYGFIFLRQLTGVGFDMRLRRRDVTTGVREFAFYAPMAVALGLALGFLHFHAALPRPLTVVGAFCGTFLAIGIPEELYFRGWMQNLLERRLGRIPALLLTAVLFGLSHFNKRTANFNWRYVVLAAIAGIFYGRAWRRDRRVGASVIAHTCVDTVWSQWLR
jgi:membrane protease YdiL (CAAX protease family)